MTPEEYAENSIYGFLEYYQITNDEGRPLDFKDHSYLWDIYGDWSQVIACAKAAQIGFSTMANIKALYAAKNKGLNIIYSLPTANDVNEFVAGKTNKLIAANPIFQKWTDDKDSISQKQVGNRTIYFRGTMTERAALAIPADLYIADEVDRSDLAIVKQYQTRLQHSDFQWRWYFSNPSIPGVGVDEWWEKSDQKHWFIKCEHCNHDQFLTMENIMERQGGHYFGCTKCKKELNRRYNKGKARWIKKWRDRPISGYWISLLMNPKVSADEILNKKKEYTDDQFSNYVLGQPYLSRGAKLMSQLFFQNLVNTVNPQDSRPIIGVDTGININYVVGNKYGLFFHDKANDYSDLEKLMRRWPNAIMVIDQGGDIIGPRKLRELFPGRVFLCFFGPNRKNDQLVTWNDDDGTVVADRDKLIQLVVDEITERRIPIYGTQDDWYDVWLEWDRMRRVEDENALGNKVYHWEKTPGQRSDYPFCFVYWRIGMGRFLEEKVSFHDPSSENLAYPGMEVNIGGGTYFNPRIIF